jgi:hypothetical protein
MRVPNDLSGASFNRFNGPLMGTLGGPNASEVAGNAAGSFVRSGNDVTKGIMGNWNAGNSNYHATGIFGAGKAAQNPNGALPPIGAP